MRNTIITTALATFALAATSTSATAQDQVQTAFVEHADLNIASEQGMETLQNRVRAAVRKVCPRPETVRPISQQMDFLNCREEANADAQQQIGQLRRGSVEILAVRAPENSETSNQ